MIMREYIQEAIEIKPKLWFDTAKYINDNKIVLIKITLESIGVYVCSRYNISFAQLINPIRIREVVLPRQICHLMALEFTNNSLRIIGEYFGNKDHSTVLYSKKTILGLIESDKKLRSDIEKFRNYFRMTKK